MAHDHARVSLHDRLVLINEDDSEHCLDREVDMEPLQGNGLFPPATLISVGFSYEKPRKEMLLPSARMGWRKLLFLPSAGPGPT
jgi:hypothetical protein